MAYRPGFRISQSSLPAADQIKSLIRRGMAVPDEGLATRYLTHIGYRRLSSYWWLFQTVHRKSSFFQGKRQLNPNTRPPNNGGDAFPNETSPLYSFQWYSVEGEESNETNTAPKT